VSIGPIHPKARAAASGGGAGAVAATFVLWLLGVAIWHQPNGADQATAAIAAVPWPVAAVVLLAVPAAGAFLNSYTAPHLSQEVTGTTPAEAPPAGQHAAPALTSPGGPTPEQPGPFMEGG